MISEEEENFEKEKQILEEELNGEYIIKEKLSQRCVLNEQMRENRSVYLAIKKEDNSPHVIKQMNSFASETFNEKFASEHLKNHSTITLSKTTCLENNTKLFVISNYCEGGTLETYFNENYLKKGKAFEIDKIIYVMKNIIFGLKTLFECELIHRDIKKGNLVIKYFDDESSKEKNILKSYIIIIDFGSCKMKTRENSNIIEVKGTPPNIHPTLYNINQIDSQNNDAEVLNEELDLWSLGVVCLQLFGGRLSTEKEKELEVQVIDESYYIPLNDDTTVELVRFIDKLLQKIRKINLRLMN